MRYFAEISYDGTRYVGWQIQPNGESVQQVIQEALSRLLQAEIEVVGCGRTDSGVHAIHYVLHFDSARQISNHFVDRLNKYLPPDIAFYSIYPVDPEKHARFSALGRGYEYEITFRKEPLHRHSALFVYKGASLDWDKIKEATELLMEYDEFKPFCKTGSETPHFKCSDLSAEWIEEEHGVVFSISANRFLRGMVRLIVGTLLRVGKQEITVDAIRQSMDNQQPLPGATSAPAHGLKLVSVEY